MKKYFFIAAIVVLLEALIGPFDFISSIFSFLIIVVAIKTVQFFIHDPKWVFKSLGIILGLVIWYGGSALYSILQPAFYLGLPVSIEYGGPERAPRLVYQNYELSVVADHLTVTNTISKKHETFEVRPLGCRDEVRLNGVYYESGVLYTELSKEWSACMGAYKQKFDISNI